MRYNRYNVYMPDDVHEEMKATAELEHRSLSEVFTEACHWWLTIRQYKTPLKVVAHKDDGELVEITLD